MAAPRAVIITVSFSLTNCTTKTTHKPWHWCCAHSTSGTCSWWPAPPHPPAYMCRVYLFETPTPPRFRRFRRDWRRCPAIPLPRPWRIAARAGPQGPPLQRLLPRTLRPLPIGSRPLWCSSPAARVLWIKVDVHSTFNPDRPPLHRKQIL